MNKDVIFHKNIRKQLDCFINANKIPNLIFYGDSGSGKGTLIRYLIDKIYNGDSGTIQRHVMFINCAHGKGIKFIRDNLKFFAKTNINIKYGLIKSIILLNADKLTIDAQSALRRCIEQYCHTTRFIIKVDNYNKLLRPIISRFSCIYVPLPSVGNLHKYNLSKKYDIHREQKAKNQWIKRYLQRKNNIEKFNEINLIDIVDILYNRGYSSYDVIDYIGNYVYNKDIKKNNNILLFFKQIKKEIRNEKILMYFFLHKIFIRSDDELDNILFI
tara:strand:- start:576 stop:1391 length:816 start_codon:yes stop_codon:yes gene_type:complete